MHELAKLADGFAKRGFILLGIGGALLTSTVGKMLRKRPRMSEEIEITFRKTLDDVDRIKRRQIIAFAALFCVVSGCLFWLGHLGPTPNVDVRQMLLWSVITLVFVATYAAMGLALYINKMFRKVLKAIEPLSSH
jgi:hypothetical protein